MKTIIERWIAAKNEHDTALANATAAAEKAKTEFESRTGQKLQAVKYWYFAENEKSVRPVHPLDEKPSWGRHDPRSLKRVKGDTEWLRQATPEFFALYIQRMEDSRD